MIVKLLTEQHLAFLSLKRGCTGSSESTLVKCHIVGNSCRGSYNVILIHSAGERLISIFLPKIGRRREKTCHRGFANKSASQPAHRAVGSAPLFFAYIKVSYQHFIQGKFQFSS